ncbi:MAG: FtsX-like permease family protein [Thermoanaerobaculia bacterium]
MSLLGRASRRYHPRHPAQFGLALAGIAVGRRGRGDRSRERERGRSFELATVATAGAATHEIRSSAGELDERWLARLRIEAGIREVAPIVDETVLAGDPPGRPLRLLGIDPWSEAPFRGLLAATATADRGPFDLVRFATERGAAVVSRDTARALDVALDDELEVAIGGRRERLRIVGLLEPGDEGSRAALTDLALVDLATAQELLDLPGKLSRLELLLPEDDPRTPERIDRITALLPSGLLLARTASRPETLAQMTRAFRFNLRALSLLALLCGSFLIYNALTFSVVQRRDLFGRLRALGVRRIEIVRRILAEAVAVGLLGSAIGLALGVILGRGVTALVLTTIRDLYFASAVGNFGIPPGTLLRGTALGVAAALAAAVVPAFEAASSPPRTTQLRSALEERVQRLAGVAALAGIAFLVVGSLLFLVPTRALALPLAAFFLVLVGCAFAIPWLLARGMNFAARRLATLHGKRGLFLRNGARAVGAALSRTGVAVAALAVAVSVSIAVAVMIGSFRQAVQVWLDAALVGDLYVSTPSRIPRAVHLRIPPATVDRIRGLAGVARVNTLRTMLLEEPGRFPRASSGSTSIAAAGMRSGSRRVAPTRSGAPWTNVPTRRSSPEPFAYRRGLHAGDRFELPTPSGRRSFLVAGIDYDYGSDQGVAKFTDRTFRALFGETDVAVLAVFARPGTELENLGRRIRETAPPGALEIQPSAQLKQMSVEIFDRTFRITGILRLLAIAVAVLGILAALAAYEIDRRRELALLRALGLTRRELLAQVGAETGWIGLAAGLFSLPLGLLLAALMVHVINRRSFGWSMELLLPLRPFAEAVALSLAAALLAGILPAIHLTRADPSTALREE